MSFTRSNQTSSREDHPVWEVYDLLRTARLNELYYAAKLKTLKRRHWWMEIAIAVTTPAAAAAAGVLEGDRSAGLKWLPAVSSIVFVDHHREWIVAIWALIAALASFLALAKPFMRLGESIGKVEACHAEYRSIAAEVAEVRSEVRLRHAYIDELQTWFRQIRRRKTYACEREPPEPVDTRLTRKIEARINRELPADAFYVPEE